METLPESRAATLAVLDLPRKPGTELCVIPNMENVIALTVWGT